MTDLEVTVISEYLRSIPEITSSYWWLASAVRAPWGAGGGGRDWHNGSAHAYSPRKSGRDARRRGSTHASSPRTSVR